MDEIQAVTDVGDPVEATYRAQADRLWRALVLMSGDRDVASDAVSEAFAQAIARGQSIDHLDRWVWRAAFKIARGDLKRRGRWTAEMRDLPAEVPDGDGRPRPCVSQAVTEAATSVVLHHDAGYSARETAQMIGSTPGAVGIHLDRGRKRLRELLGEEDV